MNRLIYIRLSFYYEINNSVIGGGDGTTIYLCMNVDGVDVDVLNDVNKILNKQKEDIAAMCGADVKDISLISKEEHDKNTADKDDDEYEYDEYEYDYDDYEDDDESWDKRVMPSTRKSK